MNGNSWQERLRRWWVGIALLVGGIACVLMSFAFLDAGWISGVLIEFGATFVLFAPLLLLQRRIETRFKAVKVTQQVIQKRQSETAAEISALAEEVAQTNNEMRQTIERISNAVFERLQEARAKDKESFTSVGDAPSLETVGNALRRAQELGLISHSGCRVSIFETPFFVRFIDYMPDEVKLILEDLGGNPLEDIYWTYGKSAADILLQIAEQIQVSGQYPGDALFDPAKIFTGLRDLLKLAHRQSTGEGGLRIPLGQVIEFCAPQWVVTEMGVIAVAERYTIKADRLEEMDWYDHVRHKGWVDASSLFDALESGRALYLNGRLAVKPPGWREEAPF